MVTVTGAYHSTQIGSLIGTHGGLRTGARVVSNHGIPTGGKLVCCTAPSLADR